MPRYVILAHDHPAPHWDFMLESGPVLRSWRLADLPRAGGTVPATATFDHRLLYLDYEGPVSGGRGQVARWDTGSFSWQQQASDRVVVLLQGRQLQGWARLAQVSGSDWSFTFDRSPPEEPSAKENPCR
jgi:hypothetical protein